MTTTKKLDALTESLEQLEKHLELPYISGELHDWSEQTGQLLQEATTLVRSAIHSEHGRAYEAIVKNHPNLRQEVENLRKEEPSILAALEAVQQLVEPFTTSIDETVLAGQQFQPKREQLVQEGLAAILRVRRHRAAIETWLSEALQRDNGVGD